MSDDHESGKWLKVKARMPQNQKVIALSDAAFRLHISVECWCCDEVNDGIFKAHVPAGMPRAPTPKKLPAVIKELVDRGLWRPTEDGYEINDFLKYNMSRVQWEAKKAAGRTGGKRSGESRRGRGEAPPEAPASPPPSAPAQPVPQQKSSRTAAPPEHENDHDQIYNQTTTAQDLTGSAREDAEAAAAAGVLQLGAAERARLLLASESLAPVWRPESWPEVLAFVSEVQAAAGRGETSLGPLGKDKLVRLLVERLAAGDTPESLLDAAPLVGAWLAQGAPDGKRRQLSWITFEVLRTALDEASAAAECEAGATELIRMAEQNLSAGGAS